MEKQNWKPLSRQGVRVRMGICSDLHVCGSYPSREKLHAVFSAFHQLDPLMDAAAFVGDLTDFGTKEQYAYLGKLIQENAADGIPAQLIYCIGNHDTFQLGTEHAQERFARQTGQQPEELVWVGGIPVIKLAANQTAEEDYTDSYSFLKESLREAASKAPGLPILVLAHHGIQGTAYGTDKWYGNYGEGTEKNLVELMRQYPQIIHISGHSHATLEDERSIDQHLGFTAIQDGTAGAYFENETGKIDPETGEPASVPPYGPEACQALVVDVLCSGKVIIHRLNMTAGRSCGPAWEADVPALKADKKNGFSYLPARKGAAPVFPKDVQTKLRKVGEQAITVTFPRAFAGDGDSCSMVHSYCIRLLPEGAGVPFCRWIFADYYRREQRAEWCVRINLEQKLLGRWYAQVRAATSFGQLSSPLRSEKVLLNADK